MYFYFIKNILGAQYVYNYIKFNLLNLYNLQLTFRNRIKYNLFNTIANDCQSKKICFTSKKLIITNFFFVRPYRTLISFVGFFFLLMLRNVILKSIGVLWCPYFDSSIDVVDIFATMIFLVPFVVTIF